MTDPVEQIKKLLEDCTDEQRRAVLSYVRERVPIHPLEHILRTPAEVILEALSRASDLTMRGIRGILAEAAFAQYVLGHLSGWQSLPLVGDPPYDYLLEDSLGQVRVQVKLQRSVLGRPMRANEARKGLPSTMYVVETQRTRTGLSRDGRATRPYRFGEFDILAVCMYPSTGSWETFMYTVAGWLLPRADGESIAIFQPVAPVPDYDWTDSFEQSVAWFRSGVVKAILSHSATEG